MNLEVPGAILPHGCAILSTRAKTIRGVVATPLRRTRVKLFYLTKVIDFIFYLLSVYIIMMLFGGGPETIA